MPPSDDLRAELQRRESNTEKGLAIFRASPRGWISWTVFADAVGERAYRTRISNAKKHLKLEGGTIESRTFKDGLRIVTEYRFLDYQPLGRPADVPAPTSWPVFDAPSQEPWSLK